MFPVKHSGSPISPARVCRINTPPLASFADGAVRQANRVGGSFVAHPVGDQLSGPVDALRGAAVSGQAKLLGIAKHGNLRDTALVGDGTLSASVVQHPLHLGPLGITDAASSL